MPTLHLVRHGHAAAGWGHHLDPGLDEVGRAQASAVAGTLAHALAPRLIVTSPMARARETAAPLAAAWGTDAVVDPAFGEIPSPTEDLSMRRAWLASALASQWDDLDAGVSAWRRRLLDAAAAIEVDTVAFTHFVAINAVVAAATAEAAVTVFLPGNGSVTHIEVDPASASMRVIELGSEATPEVG